MITCPKTKCITNILSSKISSAKKNGINRFKLLYSTLCLSDLNVCCEYTPRHSIKTDTTYCVQQIILPIEILFVILHYLYKILDIKNTGINSYKSAPLIIIVDHS